MSSKNNFSKLLGTLVIVLALSFSTSSYATISNDKGSKDEGSKVQKSEDKNDDDSGSKGESTSVPLDGGLSILLLGAAAFGVKKLRDNKK